MLPDNIPKTYMGYPVPELLQVLKEIQGSGTKAPKEKILAMDELVREYKLTPVHQVPMDAPGRLNFSSKNMNQCPTKSVGKTIHLDSSQSRHNERRIPGLPEHYMGFPISELLDILKELQAPQETTAPEEKKSAVFKLVREYKLTIVYSEPYEPKKLNSSISNVNPHTSVPVEENEEMDVHERIAQALLNIDKSDFNPGQDLLDQGKWIIYDTDEYPGYTVKEYPNGVKELLDNNDSSNIVKIILPKLP